MHVILNAGNGMSLKCTFTELGLAFGLSGARPGRNLVLVFEWDPGRTAFIKAAANRLDYRYEGFGYSVRVARGQARSNPGGVIIESAAGVLDLALAQPA